jgi:hypothetical protein
MMVQYYKIIDTKEGHNGFFYKLGINRDPNARPLNRVGSCEPGALYYTTAEYLHEFLQFGKSIAYITPIGEIKPDTPAYTNKWKSSAVRVTKIVPLTANSLYDIPGLSEEMHQGIVGFDFSTYSKKHPDVRIKRILDKKPEEGKILVNLLLRLPDKKK